MTIDIETLALERLAFGPRPGAVAQVKKVGYTAWLNDQLNPPVGDDVVAQEALLNAILPIAYTAADGTKVREDRPLKLLGKPIEDLWPLHDNDAQPIYQERIRPAQEVRAATMVRAVNASYQLREVMVRFWQDHFSLNALGIDEIAVGLPVLDRTVYRPNALGNFKDLVLGVGKSTSMLQFLDQAASAKKHPNENYARELMELHTLGIANYRGRGTTGVASSDALGYSDQDVTEAARALTGWTVANGRRATTTGALPNTGAFIFAPGMHDTGSKKLLGLTLGTSVKGEAEGDAIVTALARSPSTARFVVTKLCRRLVADTPPTSLVDAATQTWMANLDSPNQIREVVRTIALSTEFANAGGAKIKTPFELFAALLRATQIPWQPNANINYNLETMGFRLLTWPTPDGLPDTADAWLGVSSLAARWNAITALLDPKQKIVTGRFIDLMPATVTKGSDAASYWAQIILGDKLTDAGRAGIADFMTSANPFANDTVFKNQKKLETSLRRLVALIAALPEFQYRG